MKNLNRWVYAIIGVITLLLAGLVYAWSVMSKSIGASRPDWTAAQLSMTFTMVMAFFCIGCLIAGMMAKKVSPKIYIILLMGFGLSSFIIGKVFAAVTPSDGTDKWQATFRVLGIIIVIVMVICSFFFVKPEAGYNPGAGSAKAKAVREPACEVNTGKMATMPTFWFYYIWAILVSAAGLALVSQASGIASQVGTTVSDGNIATVVGLISIFNGIGRVIFGGLFDKKGYRFTMILDMIIFIVAALILVLALVSGNFAFIVIGFVVGGLAYGGVTPTNSAIISDFFGRENYSMNFSLINTNLLIASFASTIAGKLYDASGSFMTTIFMMIIVTVLGFVVSFGVRRPKNK